MNKFNLQKIGLKSGDVICSLDEIPDGEAKEFSFRDDSNIFDFFIQRMDDKIYAYTNNCPHAGTPLNMEEGKFVEKSGQYIMCHTHGALFQLDDGLCVAGPCNGDHLEAVDVYLDEGKIIVG